MVWVSGASGGIGGGLARHQPFDGARVINLDIAPSAEWETVTFDLSDPGTWQAVDDSFRQGMPAGPGGRVRFLHCAYAPIGKGLVTEVDPAAYRRGLVANLAGVPAIAAAFLRAVPQGVDAGLMVMSSGAAEQPLVGYSNYGPAKRAVEHWVRITRREVRARGLGPWITALRPGIVDTPTARAAAQLDPATFPLGAAMVARLDRDGSTVDDIARRIWAALERPDPPALIDLDGP